MRSARWFGAVVAAVAVAAGCSSGTSSGKAAAAPTSSSPAEPAAWPAPANPMARASSAGLVPETAESLQFHVHAHLDVYVNGQQLTVPAGLGIDIDNSGVHTFPEIAGATGYGGIDPPCDTPCISPLHTHDVSGVIHTESATRKYNTLGQLFTEWGVRLDSNCVDEYCKPDTDITVSVNGKPRAGDPRTIPLTNFEEIAIVIGTPPENIPSRGNFSNL
jgi:hypothetical protein